MFLYEAAGILVVASLSPPEVNKTQFSLFSIIYATIIGCLSHAMGRLFLLHKPGIDLQ